MNRKTILSVIALLCAATYLAIGLSRQPAPSRASDGNSLSDYMLFGIDGSTNSLIRYGFHDNQLKTVGVIKDYQGNTMSGIEGAAHVPGHLNVIGFWRDADLLTRIVYINTGTAKATPVGADLGLGVVTGATTAKEDDGTHRIYAVQQIDDGADTKIEFVIQGNDVVPSQKFAAKVSVLGAAITAGGKYDVPVTVRVSVSGYNTAIEPWGSLNNAVTGNVNDDKNARHHVLPDQLPAGAKVSVTATSWLKKSNSYSGSSSSHWEPYMTVSSTQNTRNVKVLRNGDNVPNITPFQNQSSILSFVQDFVDSASGKITLEQNQAIALFELGTSNLNSSAADFQDLVVLITFAEHPDQLKEHEGDGQYNPTDGPALSGKLSINPNNSDDGEFTLWRADGSAITRDNLHENATVGAGGVFYEGDATRIFIKPKGSGSQNTMVVDGSPISVANNRGYEISSRMQVKVYNTNIDDNGKAMGQWVVEFVSGGGTVTQTDTVTPYEGPAARLILVNHKQGGAQHIMSLNNLYDSLASAGDGKFLGTLDNQLYLINTKNQTETRVGTMANGQNNSLEMGGPLLLNFSTASAKLSQVNKDNASVIGSPMGVGVTDLRSLLLVQRSKIADFRVAYD